MGLWAIFCSTQALNLLPCLGVVAEQAPRLVWLAGWVHESGRTCHQVPWPDRPLASSGDRQSHWLGSLCSYYYIWVCRIVYASSQVLWLGFLFWQDRRLYSALGGALSSLPCQGWRIEWAPRCVWLIYWGHNQPELLPGQTGPPTQLCRWAEPLATISTWLLLQGRLLLAKIWALVAVNPTPTPPSQSDPQGSSLTDFPYEPCEARPKWAFQEASHSAGRTRCSSWALFFPTGETIGRGRERRGCLSVPRCAGLGRGDAIRVYGLLSAF